MPAPRRAAQASPWLLTALLLSGCSGTPLGDRLSRSFPGPGAPGSPADPVSPAAPTAPGSAGAPATPAGSGTTRPAPGAPSSGSVPGSPRPPAGASSRPPAAPPSGSPTAPSAAAGLERWLSPGSPLAPSKPAPYRVTIRLPRADPAAPAEVVTRALRAAGVPFEVEMIERVQPGGAAGGNAAAPSGLPEVRPAPPPR